MKILQVMPRLSKSKGGGGVVIGKMLTEGLVENGHNVGILSSDHDFDLDYMLTSNLDKNKTWFFPFKTLVNIASLHITKISPKQLNSIFSDGVDVVHMQGCRTFQNIVARIYAKKYKIPYIVDAHGFPVEGTWWRRQFIKLFDIYFANDIVKDATCCVAETQVGEEEYKRAGVPVDKIVTIPCGYDLSLFDDLPDKGKFKEKYGLQDKKVVLYLGGIDYIKGLDFLAKAFSKIQREDVALVFVGTDFGFEQRLKVILAYLEICDKTIFAGGLYGQDKLEALVDADVAVFPSRAEQGLPFAGLEAIMCGTPIIVTEDTGAGEDVKRMGGGYTVEFGDTKMLTSLIERMLDNNEITKAKMVKSAQDYIVKNLSIKDMVVKYEELYKQCIKEVRELEDMHQLYISE